MPSISPWTSHRNRRLWRDADCFDPDRSDESGVLLSFGLGPRVCIGAAFATIESGLILAELVRRYDFEVRAPEAVRPVSRLTTRPATEIACRVTLRDSASGLK